MKEYLNKVKATVYETNEKKEMKQNVRNEFRAETQEVIGQYLKDGGLEVVETDEGLAIRLENDVEGEIIVLAKISVKALGYDLDTAHQAHLDGIAEKKAKAEKAEADKLAKIAQQEANKKAKATK